jgi:hypothetical protein
MYYYHGGFLLKHLRKLFFAGFIAMTLFSLTFPLASASAAPHNAKTALLDTCHTEGRTVNDANGNPISTTFTAGDGHIVTVFLMYCDRWQSNFARVEVGGPSGSITLNIAIHGTAGSNPGGAQAQHTIATGQSDWTGSQDSPTYYAPVERTYACASPVYTWVAGGSQCTIAV